LEQNEIQSCKWFACNRGRVFGDYEYLANFDSWNNVVSICEKEIEEVACTFNIERK